MLISQSEQDFFNDEYFNFYLFAKITFIILPFFVRLVSESFNGAQLKTIYQSNIKQKTPSRGCKSCRGCDCLCRTKTDKSIIKPNCNPF